MVAVNQNAGQALESPELAQASDEESLLLPGGLVPTLWGE